MTSTLLFDGESALSSKKNQALIKKKFNIRVFAEPRFKRVMAERAIREIKLRVALSLHYNKMPLSAWKKVLDNVITIINMHRIRKKISTQQTLIDFFTSPAVNIPQKNASLYKFNIGDQIKVYLSNNERRDLSFKYTLNKGSPPLLTGNKNPPCH